MAEMRFGVKIRFALAKLLTLLHSAGGLIPTDGTAQEEGGIGTSSRRPMTSSCARRRWTR